MNERIAIVEDEADLARLVVAHLAKDGFRTSVFGDAESFLRSLARDKPDAVLLDLMLPDASGMDVCRKLKSEDETRPIPVIIVTARGEETDRVLGLEMGADDYIVKPFSFKELSARIRAVLRRGREAGEGKKITIGGEVEVDVERYEVRVGGELIDLTTTEFKLLAFLASKKGRVFTREQILDHLWGHDKIVLDRTVDVHIKNLRLKLKSTGRLIQNIRGVGYKVEGE
jgi:two-component system phosphate regulon response regulator PhoB/two-component system alkaline phosphatase synthesis response regulator PhoP